MSKKFYLKKLAKSHVPHPMKILLEVGLSDFKIFSIGILWYHLWNTCWLYLAWNRITGEKLQNKVIHHFSVDIKKPLFSIRIKINEIFNLQVCGVIYAHTSTESILWEVGYWQRKLRLKVSEKVMDPTLWKFFWQLSSQILKILA